MGLAAFAWLVLFASFTFLFLKRGRLQYKLTEAERREDFFHRGRDRLNDETISLADRLNSETALRIQAEQARDDAICANAETEKQLRADLAAAQSLLDTSENWRQRAEKAEQELMMMTARVMDGAGSLSRTFKTILEGPH